MDECAPVPESAWRNLRERLPEPSPVVIIEDHPMHKRSLAVALFSAAAALGGFGNAVESGAVAAAQAMPRFSMMFGNNPRSINGGNRSGVAAHKRAKAKRRNVAKHPRSAHKQGGHRWNKVRYHA